MIELLDEKYYAEPLSDKEVFTKIWRNPRKVFEFIHQTSYEKYMIPLMILSGIAKNLDKVNNESRFLILVIIIAGGGLVGWLGFYFYSAFISWTGYLLKGKASAREIVRVLAYSSIPTMITIVTILIQILFFRNFNFSTENLFGINSDFTINIPTLFLQLVNLTLGIWSIVLSVVGISVVQDFSPGKAILNLILPILILAVIFAPFVFLIV